ncbi:MAG TPA: lytic transglycosylase domain-containing protein [Candidatus Saccharimonadales bacterium]|nr:lytic transglycosylase domain-containing protein [Candidatus Saccharimonadales bacterium]
MIITVVAYTNVSVTSAKTIQPTLIASASTDTLSTITTPTMTSLNQDVVSVVPSQISISLTESEYQKRAAAKAQADAAAAQKAAAALAVKTVSVPTASDSEKIAWVQKAASAYGIDWRVLAAVWQKESGQQFYTTTRSYSGAQGPCQFMSGTWRSYAQDGNGDGLANVYDARDCLFGAAELLARNGGNTGDYTRALLSYNHAMWYVKSVLQLAASY